METKVNADLSGSDVGNHLRDEERIELRTSLDVLTIVDHLLLERVDTADAHAVNDADAALVHRLKVESRVLDTLNGANHGQLRVAVHLAHLLAVQVIADVEVFHLAGELRLEVRRIKLCNRCCAAFTSHEVLPGLLRRVTDWSNGTQACYYYSL